MAEDQTTGTGGNGASENGAGAAPSDEVHVSIAAQFVRDLSFESPNIEALLSGPGENPNLNVEINVNGKHIRDNLFESAIDFKANASNDAGVIYDLEVVYGGLFDVQNMPRESLEPFLLVECPTILFPFLRRLVADLTREGGFPPLYLDPINFAALYMQRKGQEQPQS